MSRLVDKVALVTGASRGIGRAIAQRLAAEGAHVYAAARDATKLAEVVQEIQGKGGKAAALAVDVADRGSVEAGMAAILAEQGRIDFLVNNAGVTRDTLLLRMKSEDWDQVVATNLTGVFHCTQAALKPMIRQRAGRIVSITSVVGLTGNAGQANYAASKAGIVGLTRAVAMDAAPYGVRVNCVCPAFTDTPLVEAWVEAQPDPSAAREEVESGQPVGRMGKPEEIAAAIAFLASDEASFITGVALPVDGGVTAR